MAKTFSIAGIVVNGQNVKVRFANDMVRRIKQFSKGGASRCEFVELPNEMTKLEALAYLKQHEKFQSAEDQALINDTMLDREKDSKKGGVKVSKPREKKAEKPSLEAIKARAKKETKDSVIESIVNTLTEEQPAE